MTQHDYDLFVIGAGSGGIRAARTSAGFGARVAIAEEKYLGGTCVNVGCVPKKLFVYASHFNEELADAAGYGWEGGASTFNWAELLRNKNNAIEQLHGVYERLLKKSGVHILDGRARLIDPHTVSVAGNRYRAERILVATGARPVTPEVPGKEHAITSNEAFFLDELPKRVIVAGGGYVAVEFAGIFNGLGSDTTLLHRGPLFLRGFDDDAREFLAEEMRKKGVELLFNTQVDTITKTATGLSAALTSSREIDADLIMFATGRVPYVEGLGLERVGVTLDEKGAIPVDDGYRTSVPSIYAIGDVIDRVKLTPVALAEATALARNLFGPLPARVDYHNVPTTVFSQPSLGSVGLTETLARKRYPEIDIYQAKFTPLKHYLTGRNEKIFMKLIVNRGTDRVLGAHMVGSDAGEIIQGIAIALNAGATKAAFDATIGIHPTAAEEFVSMREPVPRAAT